MFTHRAIHCIALGTRRRADERRGVILLVVLALLALFTMIGLTMVLVTAQARLSAQSSSRAQRTGTPYQQLLSRAFHEVARGSEGKFSPIRAHSLGEDLYGAPLFVGRVQGTPTPLGGGQLLQFAYAASGSTAVVPNVLPNGNFVFSGLVITMTSGDAAGRSARVVRDTIPSLIGGAANGLTGYSLTSTSFDGAVPKAGDEFVINGRPFSGTGFGFQMASFVTNPIFGSATKMLDAMDPTPASAAGGVLAGTAPQYLWPYALLPNHAQFTPQNPGLAITAGGGFYTDPGGPGVVDSTGVVAGGAAAAPGGANEPYDAPDYQNMFLAMHYFDVNSGRVLTPIPSFHRPELIAHWAQRINGGMAGKYVPSTPVLPVNLQQELRRKVILRPDPQDQGFNPATQDQPNANGVTNGVFDYREPFTDLNGNAQWDATEPFLDLNADGAYTPGDLDFTGKRFNPITGPYYISHDPISNFEMWRLDPLGGWDVDNDGDGLTDSIWIDLGFEPEAGPDGKLYKPLFAVLCVDMDGKLNVNAHGSPAQLDPDRYAATTTIYAPYASVGTAVSGGIAPFSAATGPRNFQIGEGYGTAEINLLPLLQRNAGNPALEYQQLMQGAYNSAGTPAFYINGRYGEADDPFLSTPDGNNGYAANYLISGPMPGRTQQFDPYYGSQSIVQINDPINQMMQSPLRPFLLNYTPQQANPPGYFFDFITSQYVLTGAAHAPTGFGSPHNIHGRGAILLDLRGQPYYAATTKLPWMQALVNPVGAGMNTSINDTVDDPYEFDPSLKTKGDSLQVGGNLISTVDARFLPEEVERVLRQSDVDGLSLPSRLVNLAPSLAAANEKHAVTSDSWDLPTPGVTATNQQQFTDLYASTTPNYLSGILKAPLSTSLGSMSLVDLARARILARNPDWITAYGAAKAVQYADLTLFGNVQVGAMTNPAATPPIQPLFSPDFVQGLRLDINRPLGDGVDNNNNGVVDEPMEILADLVYFPATDPTTGLQTYNNSVPADLNNDGYTAVGDITYSDARARQLLARHLYVLMMLLIDDQSLQAQVFLSASATSQYSGLQPKTQNPNPYRNEPNGNPIAVTVPSQQLAYFVAQWAINVVDFRDPDSICTPFEFDLSPFTDDDGFATNGTWDVNDMVEPTTSPTDPWSGQLYAQMAAPYTTAYSAVQAADDGQAYRGLVWGCERPELIITETIATHDRGTDDTNQAENVQPSNTQDTYLNEAGQTNPDKDYDQVRRPRGTVLVELFNPNSPLSAPQADMLQNGGAGGVNLTQVAPSGGAISPVWRLAIAYSSTYEEKNFYPSSPGQTAISTNPIDPRVPVLPANYIHRVAYFVPVDPSTTTILDDMSFAYQRFFANLGAVVPPVIVGPNCYALVGPGVVDPRPNSPLIPGLATTFFGARNKTGDSTVGPNGKQNSYPYLVQLNGSSPLVPVGLYNNYAMNSGPMGGGLGSPVGPYSGLMPEVNIKNVVGLPLGTLFLNKTSHIAISAATAAATPTSATSLRFSVSEPEYGYPLQSSNLSPNPTWDDDCYYLSGGMAAAQYPTTPFDTPNAGGGANAVGVTPNTYVSPDGTTTNYTTIYLQRLANPLQPWDKTANPYLTVDSMPVDLTAYTGENSGAMTTPEPAYTNGTGGAAGMAFDARSRGQTTAADLPNIWNPASTGAASWNAKSTVAAPLQFSTLGYLNQTYWVDSTSGTAQGNVSNSTSPLGWTAGFYCPAVTDTNASTRLATMATGTGVNPAQFYGDPLLPFPWLAWPNRPFVSQYEMMLVPTSSPSSLLSDFGTYGYVYNGGSAAWDAYSSTATYNSYNPAAGNQPTDSSGAAVNLAVPLGIFQHLLNFYDTADSATVTRTASNTQPGNFFRFFEYVHVPSRFAGTQDLLNPAVFTGATAGYHSFHPPFNWQSRYRDPGRVNLNTVYDPVVFQAIMDDYPAWVPSTSPSNAWQNLWQGIVDTRRGFIEPVYNATSGVITAQPNLLPALPNLTLFAVSGQPQFPIYPSMFANPFRPEGATRLAPPFLNSSFLTASPSLVQPQGQGINATLLRAQAPNAYPDNSAAGTAASLPLLHETTFDPSSVSATYAATTGAPARQAARNAYFEYQAQTKLGNLVTNRSNVFAIWITVGYFEAVPVLPSSANPDGFQIGAEKGSDTGAFERHRAFYMFDRSVPMGFQRGEDLNVDNGILVERMVE